MGDGPAWFPQSWWFPTTVRGFPTESGVGDDRRVTREPLDVDALRALLAPAGPLARLEVVETSSSTNTELVDAVRSAATPWPAPAVLVAEAQTAGRGRAGRTWQTPRHAALTASVLLRPRVPDAALGWLPLLAGVAVARTLRDAGADARLKWPNDVLVPAATAAEGLGPFRKVAGILAEVVPGGGAPAVVVGIGVNVAQGADELSVPTATSLALEGASTDRTALLAGLVRHLAAVVEQLEEAGGDATAAGLAAAYGAMSATLGSDVRAELAAGGGVVDGRAVRLADDGALVVATPDGERTVRAGDVHHLRAARR